MRTVTRTYQTVWGGRNGEAPLRRECLGINVSLLLTSLIAVTYSYLALGSRNLKTIFANVFRFQITVSKNG